MDVPTDTIALWAVIAARAIVPGGQCGSQATGAAGSGNRRVT
jgi:hypothetical protein